MSVAYLAKCIKQTVILIMDLRVDKRTNPLCWHIKPRPVNIGSVKQIELLETFWPSSPMELGLSSWVTPLPEPSPFLVAGGQRFRLAASDQGVAELACSGGGVGQVSDLARMHPKDGFFDGAAALDYGCRWGIEPLFSEFNSRGFDLQKSQMKLPGRLSKMVRLLALAMRVRMAAEVDASIKRTEHGGLAKKSPSRLRVSPAGLRWLALALRPRLQGLWIPRGILFLRVV